MTRFMMSLDQAVELVLFAFENCKNGDIFVQKAPAASIKLLANTLQNLLKPESNNLKVIGTRHGEKLYETLLTKEEMARAIEMDRYYKIPADIRDLNYMFIDKGKEIISNSGEYHSHNTYQLNEKELRSLLLNLHEIKNELKEFGVK